MGDSLAGSLADLKDGIEAAKLAAQSEAKNPTDAQDPEGIIEDILCADLADAIHAYTKSAQVVTKSDIASGKMSTDPGTDAGGSTQADGGANSVPADSQGGEAMGLTELDRDALHTALTKAYTDMMTAGQTEVQDTEMAEGDKTTAIEDLIHAVLSDGVCTAVQDYVEGAVVKTTVTVEGGVAVSGGDHTSLSIASNAAIGQSTPAEGVTDEYADATGEGKVS